MTVLDFIFRRPTADELTDEWAEIREEHEEQRRRQALLASGEMEEDEELSGISAVHWAARRPRWSTAPTGGPGWYWCKRVGTSKYEPIRVEAGFDYPTGFEYAGPLPLPL